MPRAPIPPVSVRAARNARVEDENDDIARFEFRATKEDPNIMRVLGEGARIAGVKPTVFARQAVHAATERVKGGMPIKGGDVTNDDLEGGPLLDVRVACGPPEEAREDAQIFTVSRMVADEVGFKPDSAFFARTRGESMEAAGILDEFVVCFSPLRMGSEPRYPQIALVALEGEDGVVRGTVKRWKGKDGDIPVLLDGNGDKFEIPVGTKRAWPVAVATGVIGAL